jgi:hypothetical protein
LLRLCKAVCVKGRIFAADFVQSLTKKFSAMMKRSTLFVVMMVMALTAQAITVTDTLFNRAAH